MTIFSLMYREHEKPAVSGGTAAQISRKIEAAFSPTEYKLINDSDKHRRATHSAEEMGIRETHFTLIIVSDLFADMVTIERHRKVYAALETEMNNKVNSKTNGGLHALSLHLYTPEEWQKMNRGEKEDAGKTPPCLSRH